MTESRSSGASVPVTGFRETLASWWRHHRVVAVDSLKTLLATWATSLMTWLVIGIALALPAFLYLLLVNIGEVSGDWDGKPRISLYLKQDVLEVDARAFARQLEMSADIEYTRYISPMEALAEFEVLSGFADVLNTLSRNPLPAVIEIKPVSQDVGQLRLQATALSERAPVASVAFDLEWIERLYALLSFAERLVTALGFVLSLGVLLAIGNTIRLAIENRRSEIEIIKLVGGTNGFVRRPFIYLGFWYGFGGSLIAWVLLQASFWFLAAPVEILAQSYRDNFSLSGLGWAESLLIIGVGSLLGILGAFIATGHQLREIEPE